jgi:hypothetical protein
LAAVVAALSLTAAAAAAQPAASGSIKATGSSHFSVSLDKNSGGCEVEAKGAVVQVSYNKPTKLQIIRNGKSRAYHNLNLAKQGALTIGLVASVGGHRRVWIVGAAGAVGHHVGTGSATVSSDTLSGHLTANMEPETGSGILAHAKPLHVVANWHCSAPTDPGPAG